MSHEVEREAMVARQLIPRGISDERVLAAFRNVPRHKFVPGASLRSAYDDHPLPIGEKQTISQPYMVALMTELLCLTGTETVLEIGTGSGYQAAILAELAAAVYSVERFSSLAEQAQKVITALGYKNVTIHTGDGTVGWQDHAPYDGIIVTAGAPDVPASLLKQLKDKGKLVIPVGGSFSQVLTVLERQGSKIARKEECGCVFVPLVGKEGWQVDRYA